MTGEGGEKMAGISVKALELQGVGSRFLHMSADLCGTRSPSCVEMSA